MTKAHPVEELPMFFTLCKEQKKVSPELAGKYLRRIRQSMEASRK